MNEILARKHLKKVLNYGIPKHIAKDIIDCAMETSSGKGIELYISYAINLIYGLKVDYKSVDNSM